MIVAAWGKTEANSRVGNWDTLINSTHSILSSLSVCLLYFADQSEAFFKKGSNLIGLFIEDLWVTRRPPEQVPQLVNSVFWENF